MTPEERFLSKVETATNGCWEWRAARASAGYGKFAIAHRRWVLAHRWAYERWNGPIPQGECVMHTCDNPPCCNPSHLSLGSRSDNHADMVAKRRHTIGVTHPQARLTERQVVEIRRARATGEYAKDIAARYGISDSMVYRIEKRLAWRHVPELEIR